MRASFNDLFRSLTDREIDLAQQMLRVLVRLQIEAPETVETSVQQQAALRNDAVWYSGGTNFADGSDHDDDQDHVHFHRAERVALGLFEDMIYGGGCGEEGCCGPAAVGFNGWRPVISYVHQIKTENGKPPPWVKATVTVLCPDATAARAAVELARASIRVYSRLLADLPAGQHLQHFHFEDVAAAEAFKEALTPAFMASGEPHPYFKLKLG